MAGSKIGGTINATVTLGTGISVSPLTVTASGLVDPTGHAAIGIYLPAGMSGLPTLVNDGRIYGATGRNGGLGDYGTNRGAGAVLAYSAINILNNGLVAGGAGGSGTNDGPNGGYAIGLGETASSRLTNTGTILGGAGGYGTTSGGQGGAGVITILANRVTITNSGTIRGGSGGIGFTYGGAGGYGVRAGSGSIDNTGDIFGGQGGNIRGNTQGGEGGGGVDLGHADVLTNSGTIAGGIGGLGYYGQGGNSGAGVMMEAGGTLDNTGKISGGAAGRGYNAYDYGEVGDGVVLVNAGTLINAGTINGGIGLSSNADYLIYGDAVLDEGSNFLLVVEPGAAFIGDVVASATYHDVYNDILELDGTSSQALTGIGTQFIGFTEIEFASGAAWTINGDAEGLAAGQSIVGFGAKDAIVLEDFAATYGSLTNGGLVIGQGTTLQTFHLLGSLTGDFIGVISGGNATSITRKTSTSGKRLASGFEVVGASGVAVNTTIGVDACLTVLSGGRASGSVADTISGGGEGAISLLVADGGFATGTTLKNGAQAEVTSGGTMVSSLIDTFATLNVLSGGVVSHVTMDGGTLELSNGAVAKNGITFAGSGGNLEFQAPPAATIYGFASGSLIIFEGTPYKAGDSVDVPENGEVSVTLSGISLNLNIAGATKGETDFKLSSGTDLTALTRSVKSAAMSFITPSPEVAGGGMELPSLQMAKMPPATMASTSLWTASAAPYADIGQELLRAYHGGVQFGVTLNTNWP